MLLSMFSLSLFSLPRLNRSGLPFLTSMTDWIQAHYRSHLYGYVNGDIIFHSSIQDILPHLFPLTSPILVMGRRYNTAVSSSLLTHFVSQHSIDRFIESSVRFTEQFIPVAQDFFFFSPSLLNPREVLPVVVGRNRLDNYLLTFCKRSPQCVLVDASEARSFSPLLLTPSDRASPLRRGRGFLGNQGKAGRRLERRIGGESGLLQLRSLRGPAALCLFVAPSKRRSNAGRRRRAGGQFVLRRRLLLAAARVFVEVHRERRALRLFRQRSRRKRIRAARTLPSHAVARRSLR